MAVAANFLNWPAFVTPMTIWYSPGISGGGVAAAAAGASSVSISPSTSTAAERGRRVAD